MPVDADEIRRIRVAWVRRGNFDVLIDSIYAAYTPEGRHWWEASVLYDLRFLPLLPDLIARLGERHGAEPGFLPTAMRPPQVYYPRDEMPDDLAHDVARALDANHDRFRETHIPYSYDPQNVARPRPLHAGVTLYCRETGYPV